MVNWSSDKIIHKVRLAQDRLRSLEEGDQETRERIEHILSTLTLGAQFIDPQFDVFPTLLYLQAGSEPITTRSLGVRPPDYIYSLATTLGAKSMTPLRFGLDLPINPGALNWETRKEHAFHIGARACLMPIDLISRIVKDGGKLSVDPEEIDYWSGYLKRRT
jgi:hypothetical protein